MIEGGYAYGYLFMAQHRNVEKVFYEFLSIVKPSRILEIGTFHGGLTLLLRDILDGLKLYESPIWTYDIHDQEFLKPLVANRNVNVFTTNLFNDDYSGWESELSRRTIDSFVNDTGTTLVLCDGGCKKCEFNLIAPFLKQNDIIMAHDYAPDQDYFNMYMKDKIWNWHEIENKDIDTSVSVYHLEPYYQPLLQTVAWCSRIRKI